MRKCTFVGCDKKHLAKGWCRPHYTRIVQKGQKPQPLSKRAEPTEDRFWAKVDVRDMNGCWLWLGYVSTSGYGKFRAFGTEYAHRVSWHLFRGSIPKGMVIDHDHPKFGCSQPLCVNPDHLQAVSKGMNIARSRGDGLRKDNPTGHRGIGWDVSRQRYYATVSRDKVVHRRRFASLQEAIEWRDDVYRQVYGQEIPQWT